MKPLVDQIFDASIRAGKSIAMVSDEMVRKREEIRSELKGIDVDVKAMGSGDYQNMFGTGENEIKKGLTAIRKAFLDIAKGIDSIVKDLKIVAGQQRNFELAGGEYLTALGVEVAELSDMMSVREVFGTNAESIVNRIVREKAMAKRWMMFFELVNAFVESYGFDEFDEMVTTVKNGKAVFSWDTSGLERNLKELKDMCIEIAGVIDEMAEDVTNVFNLMSLARSAEKLARLFK